MRGFRGHLLSTAAIAAAMITCGLSAAQAYDDNGRSPRHGYTHVLLISVDSMHAVDLTRWVASHPNGSFAKLT